MKMAAASQLKELRQRLPGMAWEEFCDNFAQMTAIDFARKCCQFASENPAFGPSMFLNKAVKRYFDRFMYSFEREIQRITENTGNGKQSGSGARKSGSQTTQGQNQTSPCSVENGDVKTSPKQNRPGRKLSFRLKNIFRKQETSADKENIEPTSESPRTDILVDISESDKEGAIDVSDIEKTQSGHDIIKEGLVHELINIEGNADEELAWQKCRLVLCKAPGGYMLEFYMPPKVCAYFHLL